MHENGYGLPVLKEDNPNDKSEDNRINNEIQNFLATTRPKLFKDKPSNSNFNTKDEDIIQLLNNLEKLYRDIKKNIELSNIDELKNNLMRENINSTLICNNLIKLLKESLKERNECINDEKNVRNEMEKGKTKIQELEKTIVKKNGEISFIESSNKELNRLLQDNKNRMTQLKNKTAAEAKKHEEIKIINEELENIRKKTNNKIEILENELSAIKDVMKNKDKLIIEYKNNQKKLDTKEENLNKKFIEMENVVNVYKKKLEEKSKSLEMINNEMGNLLQNQNVSKNLNENFKEKSDYYKKLYESVNEQNEFLNDKLNKLLEKNKLKIEEDKNMDTKNDFNELKYKRRLKKFKKKITDLQEELVNNKNTKLRITNELEDVKKLNLRNIEENKKTTNELMKKLDNVVKKNIEYQEQLLQLKLDKDMNKVARIEEDEENKDEIFFDANSKIIDNISEYNTSINVNDIDNKFNKLTFDPKSNIRDNISSEKDMMIEGIIKKNNFLDNFKRNDYKEKFDQSIIFKPLKLDKTEENDIKMMKYLTNMMPISQTDKIQPQKTNQIKKPVKKLQPRAKPAKTKSNAKKLTDKTAKHNEKEEVKNNIEKKQENFIDITSSEDNFTDFNSVSTTETIKKMRDKAKNLGAKFELLNKKLENIKKNEKPSIDKLKEQVDEIANYHYSNAIELDDDSDFI